MEKLSKYLYENSVKNVILEEKLMQNKEAKNVLYSYNINILDGTKLSKFLIYNVIQKIYKYKKGRIEAGEITILTNENNDITIENIMLIARNTKVETKSAVEESVPTEIPLETNVDEDLKPVKEEDDDYQEEINVTSIKRERPDEGI